MNYNQPIRNQMKIVRSGNKLTSHPASPWRNMWPQQKIVNLSRDTIGSQGIFSSPHHVLHKPAFGLNCSCPGIPILLCLRQFLKP